MTDLNMHLYVASIKMIVPPKMKIISSSFILTSSFFLLLNTKYILKIVGYQTVTFNVTYHLLCSEEERNSYRFGKT